MYLTYLKNAVIGKQTIALLKKNLLQRSSNFFNDIDNGFKGLQFYSNRAFSGCGS
jgi:hypothetical protein